MAMDSHISFPHSDDPVILPDFGQNNFEDFEKSFFGDNALDTIVETDFIETADARYFRPSCYSEANQESSFGRVDAGKKPEMVPFNFAGSSPQTVADEEPCSFNEALFDVANYQKQSMDLKQMSMDPYLLTDDLTSLVSTAKRSNTEKSSEISGGAVVAADALNRLSLEQLRRQQSSHGFEGISDDIVGCVEGNSYYSLLSGSTQIRGKATFPSSPLNSSTFQVHMPHASISLVSEYPESLSNSSLASIVNATVPSPTSTTPCILDGNERVSIGTQADEGMVFREEMQPMFKIMSALERGGSSAVSGADQNYFSEADSSGNCLSALAGQFPCPLDTRLIQRSFSSHSLGQLRTPDPSPKSDGIPYSSTPPSDLNTVQPSGSPSLNLFEMEDRASMCSMRRVYSTGDIQTLDGKLSVPCGISSFESDAKSRETKFKIGSYTIEERKSRIHRYRKKRTERNFHKKIKYACRKTLADSRPRVRGRFARNDDGLELQEPNSYVNEDEEDDEGDALLDDKETSVVNQNMSGILRMPSVKVEHHYNSSFWNISNPMIHTSNLQVRGALN